MNPLESLAQYLDRLERRLRLFTWTRGAAAVAAVALVLTVAIVGALMLFTFAPNGLIAGRFVLFLGIGAAIAAALVVPLLRMNRRKAAQEVEHSHPGFDQRLLTFTERSQTNANDPFLPLLAEDALIVARGAEPEHVVPQKRLLQFGSVAAAAAGVLVWLMFWGPGVFGYGTALLWGSYPKDQNSKSLYSITVQPGSKTIRRRTDIIVSAKLSGFLANKAVIFVQYASGGKWEEAPMQPEPGGPGFAFLLPSIPEDLQYYVVAGALKSDTFKIHTVDLPSVKNIRVTYTFPGWTGMAGMTEDPGGDLRAVEGTMAKVEVVTDKPLANGQLAIEDGKPIALTSEGGNRLTATVPIEKDGSYHVATLDHGESVRLTDDYFIEARKVGAPVVHITKPARDQKVSPIEEVGVALSAEDEYPLQEFDLHYSVNGAAEKTISMLKSKGEKHVEGSTMLSMEEYKAVPGDIISIYATAKDGKNTTKTDMFFIEAVPFEFEYSQSQEAGGGGGGGGMDQQDQQISEREKEIIAATFNQLKADPKSKVSAADNGKYLSDVQAKLRDQAQSLANRTKARQLDGSGAAFSQFVKEMELAVAAMSPASDKLKGLQFQDALQPEQQALQHLLRAESTFRQIQVQVSRGGGGGGGGGGAGRDLANLFDLELDKDKNQYETNASSAAEQKQQQIDDALKKLEELARRQQELAQQQQNPQQLAQQRWEQEMLRREAEELKRQMEQLQRGDQSQQGQQSQQSASSSSQSSSSSSQSGQSGQSSSSQSSSNPQNGQQSQSARNQQQQPQNGQQQQQQNGQQPRQQAGLQGRQQQLSNEQLQRAIQQLEQATRDMSQSTSARNAQGGQNGQAQNEAQSAAERLKQAGQTLESLRHQQNGSELSQMADEADRLANQQHTFEDKLKQTFTRGQASQAAADQLVKDKQKLLDQYNQLQKEMQQTARDLNSTQPETARQLRDTMGRSQQAEIGTRMEVTQNALEQGMGQYAILREAPVTRALDQLRDELQALKESGAGSQSASANGNKEDKSEAAMRQALNETERVRRELEQLGRAAAGQRGGQQGNQQGRQGNQPGNQQGNQQGQQGRQGNQPGQQASNSGQQGQQGQQGGQQGQQGQQGQSGQQGGQQGSQGQQGQGGQQGGQQSAQGSPGPNGGGGGVNAGARGGAWDGRGWWGGQWWDGTNTGAAWDGNTQDKPQNPEQAYNDLQRDLNRLRGAVADDKDLTREYLDLAQRAQQLDPKHWNNQGQLDSVIGSQVMGSVDQIELMLRRKLASNDGSVRSANPRNTPPGYADAVAEYYKRLSKQ